MIGRIAGIVLLAGQAAVAAGPTTRPADPAAAKALEVAGRAVVQVLAYDGSGKLLRRGSGFAISDKGLVVTCRAIVKDAKAVSAVVPNGQARKAKIMPMPATSPDLALLEIPGGEARPLELAGGAPAAGAKVYVVGSADGLELAVLTTALAGGNARRLQLRDAVDRGLSGGPVLSAAGAVCGVALSREDGGSGSVAVPAGQVRALVKAAATGKPIELPGLNGRGSAVTFEALMGEVPKDIWPAGKAAWPPPSEVGRGASRRNRNWSDRHVKGLNRWVREQARGRVLRIRGEYHGARGYRDWVGVHLEPLYVKLGHRRFLLKVALSVEDTKAFKKTTFREGEAVEAVGYLDDLWFGRKQVKRDRGGNQPPAGATVPSWLGSSILLRGELRKRGG